MRLLGVLSLVRITRMDLPEELLLCFVDSAIWKLINQLVLLVPPRLFVAPPPPLYRFNRPATVYLRQKQAKWLVVNLGLHPHLVCTFWTVLTRAPHCDSTYVNQNIANNLGGGALDLSNFVIANVQVS